MSSNITLFHYRDYRGATIEDLDIKPAISITPTTHLSQALEIAFENEFTHLPVIHETNRKLLGVLNVGDLKKDPRKIGKSSLKPLTQYYMIWFNHKAKLKYEAESSQDHPHAPLHSTIMKPKMGSGKKYHELTPASPLEDLAKFFNSGQYFAIIANKDDNFVYGVATPEDLMRYENSRPRL